MCIRIYGHVNCTQRRRGLAFGDEPHPLVLTDLNELAEVDCRLDRIGAKGALLEQPVRRKEPALAVDYGRHHSGGAEPLACRSLEVPHRTRKCVHGPGVGKAPQQQFALGTHALDFDR